MPNSAHTTGGPDAASNQATITTVAAHTPTVSARYAHPTIKRSPAPRSVRNDLPSAAPLAPLAVTSQNTMELQVFRLARALLGGHQGNGFIRCAGNVTKLKQQRIRQVESKEREARKNGTMIEVRQQRQ